MKLEKRLRIDNVAKSREDITKKRIIGLCDFLAETTEKFFEKKSSPNISVYRSISDRIKYDSLEEFQKNFSNSAEFESIYLSFSAKLGETISLDIMYSKFLNNPIFPVSVSVYVSCNNKTEVEVEDLLQEIKSYVISLFSSQKKETINTDTRNAQPADKGNEKFWVKHRPLLEFISLLLGVIVALITIFGTMKACSNNTADDEITENQSFYSQQDEISSDADNTTLLS